MPDWAPAFLKELATRANVLRACQAAKVGRSTVYERRDADPTFAAAMRLAFEDGCDRLEDESWRRAHDGLVRKKFERGVPVIDPETKQQYVEREYSDTLMVLLLKAHRPEKFRDNVKLEHSGTVRHELDDLSEAELDDRLAAVEARIAEAEAGQARPARPR